MAGYGSYGIGSAFLHILPGLFPIPATLFLPQEFEVQYER